jgi:F-type H+-transporting ATPase subunit gamma
MAKARAIDTRRKSVRNIRKITRTMQLIATSKFQQSLNRAMASKPFTEKITELVQKISSATAGQQIDHPLLRVNEGSERVALFVITSNRGLCGGYNASLLRLANGQWRRNQNAKLNTDLHIVGKKGIGYFKFLGRTIVRQYTTLTDSLRFADVDPIAESFIADYSAGRLDAIDVVYTRFVSTGRQEATCGRLLPFGPEPGQGEQAPAGAPEPAPVQYDYSPPPAELMAELLPATVKVRLFQYFMDAIVSENVARMVAMKSATDAADDMIKSLSQQFNRARQTQITMELLDIVGGANALK